MTSGGDLLTTAQAAQAKGLSIRTVQDRVDKGILPAQKIGRDILIKRSDLKFLDARPPRGRPRKVKPEADAKGKAKASAGKAKAGK